MNEVLEDIISIEDADLYNEDMDEFFAWDDGYLDETTY